MNSQEVDKTTRRYRWNAVWTDNANGQWRHSGIFIVNFEQVNSGYVYAIFILEQLQKKNSANKDLRFTFIDLERAAAIFAPIPNDVEVRQFRV